MIQYETRVHPKTQTIRKSKMGNRATTGMASASNTAEIIDASKLNPIPQLVQPSDNALAKTNRKFMNRFQAMEKIVSAKGQLMTDLNLAEMDAIWNEVKKTEA